MYHSSFSYFIHVDIIHLLLNSRLKTSPKLMLYCLILADSKNLILSYLNGSCELKMHPAESENEALTDGRTDARTLVRKVLNGGYNIIPRTFQCGGI